MNNYQVLATKYRPKTLDAIIGQEFTVKTLKNAFQLNKIANAFIFTGIRGTGKTTLARVLAMGLNCKSKDKPTANPCESCSNCLDILNDRFEEVLEIDAASHTGVDDVREIISYIKYRPVKGSFKIFIIDEVHMLSNSAFNALLKTVEEPPDYVKFIFCTTEIRKIPITIISRCQKYDLKRVSSDDIASFLKKISDSENIKITEEAIKIISRYSEGSVRDSLSILDQAALNSNEKSIDLDHINKVLGLSGNKLIINIFYEVLKGNIKETINNVKEAYSYGGEPISIINDLLKLNYSLLYALVTEEEKKGNELYDSEMFKKAISVSSIPLLNQIWQMLIKGQSEISVTSNKIEALEVILIRIAYSSKLPSVESVVEKITKENNGLKLNNDNNHGNDVKKILDVFPGSKIIE